MKSIRFIKAVTFFLFLGMSCFAQAFTHPGILHTQADLLRMKNNINVEPYKTAFAIFSASGYAQSTNHGQGPFTNVDIGSGKGQFEIRNDAQVCHYNAIMWCVTGNTAFRDNAIRIMNAWANTLVSFPVSDHISAGTAVFDFCNAAELIRATGKGAWTAAEIARFQTMLLAYLYPPLLTPGNGVLEAAGHGGLQMKGLITLAVFCDRQDIYDFAIASYRHNASSSYGLLEYIHSSGQNYETQRDQRHASGNVGSFAEIALVAWNQGLDLFSLGNNLLAKGFESQAKIDLLYDVAPAIWTGADGTGHGSVSPDSRTPFDNLTSDISYHIFHDIKGLQMPYTLMSANIKFSSGGSSFMYRVDKTGQVPVAPPYGQPAPTDVVLFADGDYSGAYLAHFAPGSYNAAALNAGGVVGGPWGRGSFTLSSLKVPSGWNVTLYSADNFTADSIVISGSNPALGDVGWNDRPVSLLISGGGSYTVSDGTYRLVSRNSGKVADARGSMADGIQIVQRTYNGSPSQLWKIEATGNGQYQVVNLMSNKALEVAGASLSDGANIDQFTSLIPANLATGGTPSGSAGGPGEQSPQAFDSDINSKWFSVTSPSPRWLQYQFAQGLSAAVTRYKITSANDLPQRDPAAWQLSGSNNGVSWDTLDTQRAQTFAGRHVTKSYNLNNTVAYVYYRLSVTANLSGNAADGVQLSELALYSPNNLGKQQRWFLDVVPGSALGKYFTLKNVNSNKLLDVSARSTSDGASIIQWPNNGGLNQQWSLEVP